MKDRNESRLIIDFNNIGISIFDEFGRYNYVKTQEKLKLHNHKNCIEICYLSKGTQEYIVNDEKFRLSGGDIFISFPYENHGSGELPEEKGCLYWMVIKPPIDGEDFLGLSFKEARFLFESILMLPSRLFRGCIEYEKILQNIIRLYHKNHTTILDIMEIKNMMINLFILIIRLGNKSKKELCDKRINKIQEYIEEHIFDYIYISDLADMCNLSESRFKHFFKEVVGIPPAEYIIRRKIKKAEELLDKTELTIKNIAYDLGFSSPSYFSTVFKQYTGYSPTKHNSTKDN